MPIANTGTVTNREKLSAWFTPFTRNVASGNPIRLIVPSRIRRSESPASNRANFMLDDPPLIVRICGLVGSTDDPFAIQQSERGQFLARRTAIGMKNTANPKTFRDLDEHRCIFDIDDLLG